MSERPPFYITHLNHVYIRQPYGHPSARDKCSEQAERIKELEDAIHVIAPWLSASLSDDVCVEYETACNEIFRLDNTQEKQE